MGELQHAVFNYLDGVGAQLQRMPGSAIFLRYIRSSYQNDPVRSAVELMLFLFAVVYLLSPTYGTREKNKVVLTENVRIAHQLTRHEHATNDSIGD